MAPTVQAAQPKPIAQSTGAPTGGDCFLGICDPATWLQDAVGRILTNVLGGLIGGLGGILVNTASWWTLAMDVNNAACVLFGAGPPPTLEDVFWRASFRTNLILGGIYVVMGLLLVFQKLMRLALVDVLLVLAPLAALCWILPQTHGWGRLWGSLFIGTVFAQCIQVLALRLGFNLATSIPPLNAAGLVQPLLGIAVLALVVKIPGPMRGGGGGGTLVSSLRTFTSCSGRFTGAAYVRSAAVVPESALASGVIPTFAHVELGGLCGVAVNPGQLWTTASCGRRQ